MEGRGNRMNQNVIMSQYPFLISCDRNSSGSGRTRRCQFRLIPSKLTRFSARLERMIHECGGEIVYGNPQPAGDYMVTFLNEEFFYECTAENCELPCDVFSSKYLFDVYEAITQGRKIPKLGDYMITKSRFQPYDPDKILFQQTKWSELENNQLRRSRVTAQEVIGYMKCISQSQGDNGNEDVGNFVNEAGEDLQANSSNSSASEVSFMLESNQEIPNNIIQDCQDDRVSKASSSKTSNVTPPPPPRNESSMEDSRSPTPPPSSNSKKRRAKRLPSSSCSEDVVVIEEQNNGPTGLSSCEEVSYDEDEDDRMSRVSTRSTTWKTFSVNEGQRLLDIVCENNAFRFLKGKRFWELLAAAKQEENKFPGRTMHSLREHFRKKVLPKVLHGEVYRILPKDLKELQRAQEETRNRGFPNRCPDFSF